MCLQEWKLMGEVKPIEWMHMKGFIISFHDSIWVVWLGLSSLWRGRESSPCSVHGSGSLNIHKLILNACGSPEKTPAFISHWNPPPKIKNACPETNEKIPEHRLQQWSETWNLFLADQNMPTIFRVDLWILNNLIKKITFKWETSSLSFGWLTPHATRLKSRLTITMAFWG